MDIRKYESMAKLELGDEERAWLSDRAEMLAESFAALGEVGTSGIEPLVTVLDIVNVLREDIAQKLVTREELLANAPEQYDGFFLVPKTLG